VAVSTPSAITVLPSVLASETVLATMASSCRLASMPAMNERSILMTSTGSQRRQESEA
jgi:hypothetical protein